MQQSVSAVSNHCRRATAAVATEATLLSQTLHIRKLATCTTACTASSSKLCASLHPQAHQACQPCRAAVMQAAHPQSLLTNRKGSSSSCVAVCRCSLSPTQLAMNRAASSSTTCTAHSTPHHVTSRPSHDPVMQSSEVLLVASIRRPLASTGQVRPHVSERCINVSGAGPHLLQQLRHLHAVLRVQLLQRQQLQHAQPKRKDVVAHVLQQDATAQQGVTAGRWGGDTGGQGCWRHVARGRNEQAQGRKGGGPVKCVQPVTRGNRAGGGKRGEG